MTDSDKLNLIDHLIADSLEYGNFDSAEYLKCLVNSIAAIIGWKWFENKKEYLHELIGEEAERYRRFRKEHGEKCGNSTDFMVKLVQTGLGEGIKVSCPVCGEEVDLTDTSKW